MEPRKSIGNRLSNLLPFSSSSMAKEDPKPDASHPPHFLEVECKRLGKTSRFASGTKAGFAVSLINRKLDGGYPPVLYIEAVKDGEEPISFGPDAVLVDYGNGWKLRAVTELDCEGAPKEETIRPIATEVPTVMWSSKRLHPAKTVAKPRDHKLRMYIENGKIEMDDETATSNVDSRKDHRRTWTIIEEEALLCGIEELIAEGYKQKNGTFRNGSIEKAVNKLRARMPGIEVTERNITNKLKRWAIKYNEVTDMINTDGFGWDDNKKCVVVDSLQLLKDYLKKHPKVTNHVNKPYPHLERMHLIYGKNRANGHAVETPPLVVETSPHAVVTAYPMEDIQEDEGNAYCENVDGNEMPGDSPPSVSYVATSQQTPTGTSSRKHGRVASVLGESVEICDKRVYGSREEIQMLSGKLETLVNAHEYIVGEVKTMDLSRDEQIEAMIILTKDLNNTKLFLQLNGEDRLAFVRKLLS